jgi:hypothetical protein
METSRDSITLIHDGRSPYTITIASDATLADRRAAEELREHLRQVTGAELPIRNEAEAAANAPRIHVGLSEHVRQLLLESDWQTLGHDGIIMKTVGADLVLAGNGPRGTIYAVNHFLEEVVGCRWWTSTESTFPNRPTLRIGSLNTVYSPPIRYRETFYADAMRQNALFATRLKLNGHHMDIPPELGGHYTILGWCHTFYTLLPPGKYFAQHPDWYSLIEGQRRADPDAPDKADRGQLCLTNVQMREELTKVALKWIAEHPDAGVISISQNDWLGACQCDRCRAIEEDEGSPAGPVIHFVNAVAADIAKVHPDFLVETLAYVYTRQPPRHVKPARNVLVRLCSVEADFAHPLSSNVNRGFGDDLRGWAAIAPNLFVWNYTANFVNFLVPHPNLTTLAEDIRFFAENRVIGLFEQGDGFNATTGDFVQLRAWLIAHLMWDPSQDQGQLIDDFLKGYYGEAAPFLAEYLALREAGAQKQSFRLTTYNGDLSFLNADALAQAARLFTQAESAVSGNVTLLHRVRQQRAVLDHLRLLRYDFRHGTCQEYEAAADCFIESAQANGMTHFYERQPFSAYAVNLRTRCARLKPATLPVERTEAAAGSVVIHATEAVLAARGKWASMSEDPKASNGRAAVMSGDHMQRGVQFCIADDAPYINTGPWRCYMVVRCDVKRAAEGPAFYFGLTSSRESRQLLLDTAELELAADGEYHAYGIFADVLKPGMFFWVSPPANPELINHVFVDRLVLVDGRGGGVVPAPSAPKAG